MTNETKSKTAWRDFYLFNIPWLTQDAGVSLGEPEKSNLSLPKLEKRNISPLE